MVNIYLINAMYCLQATLRNACCSLQEALFAAQQQYCHHASGVVRLEVRSLLTLLLSHETSSQHI